MLVKVLQPDKELRFAWQKEFVSFDKQISPFDRPNQSHCFLLSISKCILDLSSRRGKESAKA